MIARRERWSSVVLSALCFAALACSGGDNKTAATGDSAKAGAGGEYDSETLKKSIVGFVFGEKGLIADASLEGSKISKIKTT